MAASPVDAFLAALLERHGLDPVSHRMPMASIMPTDDRVGERTASAYLLGEHLVVFCDPAVADQVGGFEPGMGSAREILDRFAAFGTEAGAEVLGSGVMRVLTADPVAVDGVVSLDREVAVDVDRISALAEAAGEDDVDEADIDLDELDPVIFGTEAEPGGALTAYASAYPWEELLGMWDVGVLTHPDHRRQGLGLRAVRHLVADLVGRGVAPLYRHTVDNAGSAALADAVGFAVATELTAIRFPE